MSAPGALSGTTSSRKPSLTVPLAPLFPNAQSLPSLWRHSICGNRGLGRGLSLLLSQVPPPHHGPELWEQGGHGGDMGSSMHGWECTLVGGWGSGPACWSDGLRQRPQHPPQAEAAGNLEVVALLQNLRGGAGDQALGPVSPLPTVVRRWWGRCPAGRAGQSPSCGRGSPCEGSCSFWTEGFPEGWPSSDPHSVRPQGRLQPAAAREAWPRPGSSRAWRGPAGPAPLNLHLPGPQHPLGRVDWAPSWLPTPTPSAGLLEVSPSGWLCSGPWVPPS